MTSKIEIYELRTRCQLLHGTVQESGYALRCRQRTSNIYKDSVAHVQRVYFASLANTMHLQCRQHTGDHLEAHMLLRVQPVLQKLKVFVHDVLFELLAPTLSPSHVGPGIHANGDNTRRPFLTFSKRGNTRIVKSNLAKTEQELQGRRRRA
jgi:hypothetical protein